MSEEMNVTSRVVSYIKNSISEGLWPVDSKIPSEHELCSLLGASRSSIRKALARFIALGILESFHGKGTYVRSTDLSPFGQGAPTNGDVEELIQLLQFRGIVEPEICGIVAERATPETIQTLQELLEKMMTSMKDSARFVHYDIQFHLELCAASGNQVAYKVMNDLFQENIETQKKLNRAIGYYGGVYYHTIIIDALISRDPKRARSAMHDHILKGMEDLTMNRLNATIQPQD